MAEGFLHHSTNGQTVPATGVLDNAHSLRIMAGVEGPLCGFFAISSTTLAGADSLVGYILRGLIRRPG